MFVEPGDAVGLAAAIERLIRDPTLVCKLATNARIAYEEYFGLERFGTEFLAVLQEAISLQTHGIKSDTDFTDAQLMTLTR